jgi:hypothetical protein
MAAITGIVYSGIRFPWPTATPGGRYAELWRIPASTAGDTQTITSTTLATIEAVVGAATHTALPLTATNTAALITSVTVAASNFADVLVIGKSAT